MRSILHSRDDLVVVGLARNRGKQGKENAFNGPLSEIGLHHPPCQSHNANHAYLCCGQIA